MKDKEVINVIYKHYIPEDWIEEFETSIQEIKVSFNKSKDEGRYYNFVGPELADIIIFIRDNPESIFLAPAIYDIVKSSLVGLWKKLKSLKVEKMKSGGSIEEKQKKISVRYEDSQNRRISINFVGNIDNEIIEEVVEKSLDVIKTDKKEELFREPDFVDNSSGKITIELKYNPKTKVWEPENFGDIRRKTDDFQKWAEANFDS